MAPTPLHALLSARKPSVSHFGTAVLTAAVVHFFMHFFASLRRLSGLSALCLLSTLLTPVTAQADPQNAQSGAIGTPQDFAALTIRPSGPEELDLATGVTTLRCVSVPYRSGSPVEPRGARQRVGRGGVSVPYRSGSPVELRAVRLHQYVLVVSVPYRSGSPVEHQALAQKVSCYNLTVSVPYRSGSPVEPSV